MLRQICVFALIAILAHNTANGQTIQARNRELVNSLFTKMSPDLPENSYLPNLVKTKLRWIIRENQAKPRKLTISASDRWASGNQDTVAMCTYALPGEAPEILVSAYAIAVRAPYVSGEQLKDMFLLSMAHEAIHLEKYLPKDAPYEQKVAEETRTWHIWLIGAVRPMLNMKKVLPTDLVVAESVLSRCNDNPECAPFKDLIRAHTPK